MVGPGEVDDDLEPETAEECRKYGAVEKCVIYEVTDAVSILQNTGTTRIRMIHIMLSSEIADSE